MINHPQQYQIEPTVHHPTGDYQNIKRLDSHRRSESSSPFQASTPRIQMSNRDDSPVIKFFNSKQAIPINGIQFPTQQMQYQKIQQEDFSNASQQYYQNIPLQQQQPQVNNRPSLGKIQLLKVIDQPQQIGNQNSARLQETDNPYSNVEGDTINNSVKFKQALPQNYQQMNIEENQPQTDRQERNRSLPLQLASYMKPSLLLEKITNTFKNKSPNNKSLDGQQEKKGSFLSSTLSVSGISQQQIKEQQNPQQIQGQGDVRQNRVHPQIFPPKIRLLQTEAAYNDQSNQVSQQTQYIQRPTRYSVSSQQNQTYSSSISPNSRIITRPDLTQSFKQPQYILRPNAFPLNTSMDFNILNQNQYTNLSGSMTERNPSISSHQELPRQIIYTPHNQPIFQQNTPARALSQRGSIQFNPTINTRQSISYAGEFNQNDNHLLNRSLNQFLPQFIQDQNKNFHITQSKIQQPITQPYIIQQNAPAQQIQIKQQQQQLRQPQQLQQFQFYPQKQNEMANQSQNNENQRRIEQNLNRALIQRYNQQSQGEQINQQNQSQTSQIPVTQSQQSNIKPIQASNTWNNAPQSQNSKKQNMGVSATQFSFIDKNDSKISDESYQKEVSSIDTKENELNQAVNVIQKLTNEKYQLSSQIEQLTNELQEQTQSQIKSQQQINLLQSQLKQYQGEVQGQIRQLQMELENEKMNRQNDAVIYNQRINEEQQKVVVLQQKNDELQKARAQHSYNIQKSIQELEQIGEILNDNDAWQKIYQYQKKNQLENTFEENSLMDKIRQDSQIEDSMIKLLDERTILMQEITNQNDFLKGKLQEFKKQTFNSNQKEQSYIHILEQQIQISEIQKKELTQEQDIMGNLYECQIAQLKAQFKNKNDIISAKYQENKFFLSQVKELENSIKKSPLRKEDKAQIGHVAPFSQVPEKTLKQNINVTNQLETPEKKLNQQDILNQSNEEEHLDQSEETSNVKQAANTINSNSSAKMNNFNNLQQIQLTSEQEELIKSKLYGDEASSSSRNRRGESQPIKPVFITYQEYNMKMNKENRLKDQLKQQQQQKQQENQQFNESLKEDKFQLLGQEKYSQNDQQTIRVNKNQYSPVIKREDQIQLTSQQLLDNKNLNFDKEFQQEETSQTEKQIIRENYTPDENKSEGHARQNSSGYGVNNKTIMDKYNDYLQGERLYIDEDVITLGQQGNHILSTIKEELQSEHQTNVSSVNQNTQSVQNPIKKNSIKNYSSYIENLKNNLKQSQEQRKQLEEQVNNIIKSNKLSLNEDDGDDLETAQIQQRELLNNQQRNNNISLQIEYRHPSQSEAIKKQEKETINDSQYDSQQIPELVDCDQYFDENELENNYHYQQNNNNGSYLNQDNQYIQQHQQSINRSKNAYTPNEPFSHQKQETKGNDYERQYQEILNQQNTIQEQFRFLN